MVAVATLDGTRAILGATEIDAFRNDLRGGVVLAGDAGYDTARRVWNGNIDRRPALIARCASAADVQHAVRLRRQPRSAGLGAWRRPQRARLRHQ